MAGGWLRHETTETTAATKTRPPPALPRQPLFAERPCRACAKYRRGQIGAAAVCGYLCELPSQPERPCQGPLSTDPVHVPAGPLHVEFSHSLGAFLLSGFARYTARKANQRRKALDNRHARILDPAAGTGANSPIKSARWF